MRLQRIPRGFSLIEVIAALLLLAIAFTALMKVAGGAIDLTHRAAQRSVAAMWARSLLDGAFVSEPIQPGTRVGRFDDQYRWQLQVTRWNPPGKPAPNPPLQLYRLDLDVSWNGVGHAQHARFSTLRAAAPGAAGGAAP
jgi:general secretion pathway protein I